MIHIRRLYASLEIEIEVRGIPLTPAEKFHIPMELLSQDVALNEAYQAFRRRCGRETELGYDSDTIRMPLTLSNHRAFGNLMSLAMMVRRH